MLRAVTVLLSLLFHGVLAYVSLTGALLQDNSLAFEQGTGSDMFVVEQGIGLEGFMQEGEAVQTVEANETPVQMSEARPQIDEVKPVEEAQEKPDEQLKDTEIVESKAGPPAEVLPVEEKKPEELKEKQQAPQAATLETAAEEAVEDEKSAGKKQTGGDAGLRRGYLGKLSKRLQSAKVDPRSRLTGTVEVRFEVAPSGTLLNREVISSSGSQILDDAALAAVDRAAPFPAFPAGMTKEKIVSNVSYRFSVR